MCICQCEVCVRRRSRNPDYRSHNPDYICRCPSCVSNLVHQNLQVIPNQIPDLIADMSEEEGMPALEEISDEENLVTIHARILYVYSTLHAEGEILFSYLNTYIVAIFDSSVYDQPMSQLADCHDLALLQRLHAFVSGQSMERIVLDMFCELVNTEPLGYNIKKYMNSMLGLSNSNNQSVGPWTHIVRAMACCNDKKRQLLFAFLNSLKQMKK